MPKRGKTKAKLGPCASGKDKEHPIHPALVRLKKWALTLFCAAVIIFYSMNSYADISLAWRKSDYGIEEAVVKSVCVIKETPDEVYAGCQRCVYKSVDSGNTWNRVYMLTGERKGINALSYNPFDFSIIYAASKDGLYASSDKGISWRRLFRGRDDGQRNVRCLLVSSNSNIIIGTERGLFKSIDNGRNWFSEDYFMNKEIRSAAFGSGFYYVCAEDGVYCMADGSNDWDKVYNITDYQEESDETEYEDDDIEQETVFINLNSIAIYDNTVYITTDRGILFSYAGSENWNQMPSIGLRIKKIDLIKVERGDILAACDKGIFRYDKRNQAWLDISAGLTNLNINDMSGSFAGGFVFSATDNGLFKLDVCNNVREVAEIRLRNVYSSQPGIDEIRQAAISYAEVSPEKIKWMRDAAKVQALIPKITFGIDSDISRSIDLDRGGTNDADFYIEGPEDRKLGWDIGLTWNLGEYVWNYHQTSIDVRSRLMVQLRNDILDQVTKLYFERLRLKYELTQNTENSKQTDLKYLRLAELTANIDALTDGYLSRNIKE